MFVFCAGLTVALSSCGGDDKGGGSGSIVVPPDPDEPDTPDADPDDPSSDSTSIHLTMVDPYATAETKALYSQLWSIAEKGFMFGHHDDLWYGRYWYNEQGNSDTKAVCGDYPAVFSFDFATIMDSRSGRQYEQGENAIRRRVILEAYKRGEVLIGCCHINNPLTEQESNLDAYPQGTSWDNTKCVDQILQTGTDVNKKFFTWLDRLAEFVSNLKDDEGKLIPVIFRPFHEHTQDWSWWGSKATTEEEFINLWRTTVRYLRDTKGVHNLIYAISPQMDSNYGTGTRSRLVFRWPGDDYVDFIGMDCYHGGNYGALKANADALSALSIEKSKPCGVTETGKESFTESNYWTQGIVAPLTDQRISMVVMWRNKYVGSNEWDKHYFSVYPGHPSEEDFRTMYDNEISIFSKDLPDMYQMAENVTVNND